LFLQTPVRAHHLWITKCDDGYVVARGMVPEQMDDYNPECVRKFWAYGPDQEKIPDESVKRLDDAKRVRFQVSKPVSLASVSCDWGYRVNTTEGKKLLTRLEAEKAGFQVISAFFSTQFSKVLFQKCDRVTRPIGMKFEIVPLAIPEKISSDEELPIQVIFDNKPMENISIFGRDGAEWKTDRNGIIRIKPAKKGLNLLMARHKVPVQKDPNKDYHLYRTFFVFEVK
jgi:uncharacterized GH25 family protein